LALLQIKANDRDEGKRRYAIANAGEKDVAEAALF